MDGELPAYLIVSFVGAMTVALAMIVYLALLMVGKAGDSLRLLITVVLLFNISVLQFTILDASYVLSH